MKYHLSRDVALKRIEFPAVYHIPKDELYQLDDEALLFLQGCAQGGGCLVDEDDGFVAMCIAEGILTTSERSVRRPDIRPSPVPSLRYLELQITNACNLRCSHCYVSQFPRRDLPPADVRAILREFEEMQGLRLMVTGGEPLMHSRFEEINDMLAGCEFRRVLFTNGISLRGSVLHRLNFHEVQVSVDGMDGGHDALRGEGSYRVVMRHIEEALAAGLQVSIASMVHRANLEEFEQMEDLFRRMGIREWTVDVPSPSGADGVYRAWWLPPEVAGRYMRFGYGAGLHGDGQGHACGLHLAAVMPEGTIARCGFFGGQPLGTIRDGLRNAWKRYRPLRLAELECGRTGCPVIDVCRGGCRFRACRAAGDECSSASGFTGRDPYKCHAYGIISTGDSKPHEGETIL